MVAAAIVGVAVFAGLLVLYIRQIDRNTRSAISSVKRANEAVSQRHAAKAAGEPSPKPRIDLLVALAGMFAGVLTVMYGRISRTSDSILLGIVLLLACGGYIFVVGKLTMKQQPDRGSSEPDSAPSNTDADTATSGVTNDNWQSKPMPGARSTDSPRSTASSYYQPHSAATSRLRELIDANAWRLSRPGFWMGIGVAAVLIVIAIFAIDTAADNNHNEAWNRGRSSGATAIQQSASSPPRQAELRGVMSCGTIQIIGGRSAEVMFVRATEGPSGQWNCDYAKQTAMAAYTHAVNQGASAVTVDDVQCVTKPDPTGPFSSPEYLLTCSDPMGSGLGLRPQ